MSVRLAAEVRRGLKHRLDGAAGSASDVRLAAEVRRGLKHRSSGGGTIFGTRSPRC